MFYKKAIEQYLPGVLTQIDRDPDSLTFGCGDRNYWHLKIRDFPSAILQQSCLTLSLVYKYRLSIEHTNCYQNKNVYHWACGMIDYWGKIQLRDGSFNEYYPYEHGFPPTAFSLYAVSRACGIMGYMKPAVRKAMDKAVNFLLKKTETEASNQEAAAIAAVIYANQILKNSQYLSKVEQKLDRFLKTEQDEGWFPEYGGVDFGYLSVTMDMLGEIYLATRQKRLLECLERCMQFCSRFIFPDGSIGGILASRNTNYFLPAGVELLGSYIESSAVKKIKDKLFSVYLPKHFLNTVDDRYLSHYVLHSVCRALLYEQEQISSSFAPVSTVTEDVFNYYPASGFLTYKINNTFVTVSANKGGGVRVFTGEKNTFNDFGYRIVVDKRQVAVTAWQSNLWQQYWDEASKTITVKGLFFCVKQYRSTTCRHIILRLLSFLFGARIINLLKNKLIFAQKKYPVKFIRKIEFYSNGLKIEDSFNNLTGNKLKVKKAPAYSLRHVASGKFFCEIELMDRTEIYDLAVDELLVCKNITFTGFVE